MNKPVKIACIGEVMIELIANDSDQATLGVAGDTYNTAVYLMKLKPRSELEVSYVTALGKDRFSERILFAMGSHGLNTDLVERREGKMPGLYAIETDAAGERSFAYWREQSAARTLFEEPCKVKFEALLDFDLVYVSGISMAILPPTTRRSLIEFLKTFKDQGGKVAYDSNYRPRLWEDPKTAQAVTMNMWALADIALPSIDDEKDLFGDTSEEQIMKRLRKVGVSFGALKRGSDGPLAFNDGVVVPSTFARVDKVVDSTAAGDSFNAGFLAEVALGGTIEEATRKGHEIASQVIRKRGAIVPLD